MLAIITLGLMARALTYRSPLFDFHSWRQSDTAAVARNFLQERFNPLYPQIDQRGGRREGYVETGLELTPSIDLGTVFAPLDAIEMRLRMDAGSVCADSIAARIDGVMVTPKKITGKPKDVDAHKVPLSATERASGVRWVLQCGSATGTAPKVAPPPTAVIDTDRDEDD